MTPNRRAHSKAPLPRATIIAGAILILLLGVGGSPSPKLPHDVACPSPLHQCNAISAYLPFRYNAPHLSPSNVTDIGFEWHWGVDIAAPPNDPNRILTANEVVDLIDEAEDLRAIVRMGEEALR